VVLAKTLIFRTDLRFSIFSDIGSILIKRAMASSSETSAVLKPQVGTENVPNAILMVLS